jgi:streptogramin lyase
MTRINVNYLPALVVLVLAGFYVEPNMFSQTGSGTSTILGTVKSSDGKPLEGVAVSARGNDKTFTTSVYTDRDGTYYFPEFERGKYKIWAQAVGFDADKKDLELSGGEKKNMDLTLNKLQDFRRQLSGSEWMASLPGDSPKDRRMKRLLTANCDSCHTIGWVLQNRFDAKGWDAIIKLMGSRIDIYGGIGAEHPLDPVLASYKNELIEYLVRVRGPDSPPLNLQPLPRPTGEAAQVVITEFDLPAPEGTGSLATFNGSDWSEGIPSKQFLRGAHDVAIDGQGNIWGTDDFVPDRSVYKLDPRTGKVSVFKLPRENGSAVSTHGIATDVEGNVWFSGEGGVVKADVKTNQFQRFPKPDSLPRGGGFVAVDSKDNVWFPHEDGAYKVDPRTGKYTSYDVVTPGKDVYGMTVDSEDNAWFAQPGGDRVAKVDGRTGKVSEVVLLPLDPEVARMEVTAQDREIAATMDLSTHNSTPLQKIPRRPGADPKGNAVWVPEYSADILSKIDIHTNKVTEYHLPYAYSQPYTVAVDKNHMVWINLKNADRIAKFDPETEKFTDYFLPTRGTETRHIIVDNSTNPPTVWTPYNRTNKIARIQFRTGSGTSAQGGK